MVSLPRLRREVAITAKDMPTMTFHQWMNEFIRSLEATLNNIDTNITSIQLAQEETERGVREAARISSYAVPTLVLTAADVGATATISVAAHTRVYPINGPSDVEDRPVAAGTITGLAFGTQYWVYYDDETLVDETPTYLATTDITTAQVGANTGRHFLGGIVTPADGAGATVGTGGTAPGNGGTLT